MARWLCNSTLPTRAVRVLLVATLVDTTAAFRAGPRIDNGARRTSVSAPAVASFAEQDIGENKDLSSQVPFSDVATLFEGWEGNARSAPVEHDVAVTTRHVPRPVLFLESATTFYDSAEDIASKANGSMNGSISTAVAVNGTSAASVSSNQPVMTTRSWLSILRLTLSFTLVVKCLCILSNVVLQASPFPLVRQFNQKRSTGEADSAPFIGIFFCACQSSFYGLFAYIVTQKSGFLVLTYSNVVGVTCGSYYVFSFMSNCDSQSVLRTTFMYLKFVATIVSVQAVVICSLPHFRALFFVGFTSSCCSLISAASLVTTVPEVLRTRCSRALPVPVLKSALVSSFLWFLCGVTLWDPYITLPNFICVFLVTYALSLSVRFPEVPVTEPALMPRDREDGTDEATMPIVVGLPDDSGSEDAGCRHASEQGCDTGGTGESPSEPLSVPYRA